jgi:hypothetical protein
MIVMPSSFLCCQNHHRIRKKVNTQDRNDTIQIKSKGIRRIRNLKMIHILLHATFLYCTNANPTAHAYVLTGGSP